MDTRIVSAGLPMLAAIALGLVSGCSDVTDLTRERVARSETSVQQAVQTVGNSETSQVDLQRAKDSLGKAQQALKDKKGQQAERYAQQAQLDAELAVSKSQTASARKAADELTASIKTLRDEIARGQPVPER